MKKFSMYAVAALSSICLLGSSTHLEAKKTNEWSFEAMDTDKDGKISKDEFKAPHLRHIEAKFTLWDKDKDGNLSDEELNKGRKKARRHHKKKKAKMMKMKEEMKEDMSSEDEEIEEKKMEMRGDGEADPEDAISQEYEEGQTE